MDKGAINDGHVLMVPIEHFPNTIGISPKAHAEMERYLTALSSCYAAEVCRRPLPLQTHPKQHQARDFRMQLAVRRSGARCLVYPLRVSAHISCDPWNAYDPESTLA